jgi:hypothetical protein
MLAVAVCAEAPGQQAATPTPPATPAVTTSQAASASSSSSQSSARDLDKRARAVGLLPETHQGTTFYCKNGAPVGTRFQKKTCYSGDQVVMMIEQLEQQKNLLDSTHGGPQSK